jgi:prepilin-type N-terminal cleavage/methylation domain-containing protein/prepilin-type processing-associated H-X9-DG protein
MRRRHAFTLVELLVVIGIIALLISILLPALQQARRHANQIKCLASLREIGNGFSMYAVDNKGYWPTVRHDAIGWRWTGLIAKYMTKQKIDSYMDIHQLRRNSVMWGCPEWAKSQTWNDAAAAWSAEKIYNGYGMQPYCVYFEQGMQSKWLATNGQYQKAATWGRGGAERGLVMDAQYDSIYVNSTLPITSKTIRFQPYDPGTMWAVGDVTVDARHVKAGTTKRQALDTKSVNMLFCDGHAAPVTPGEAFDAIYKPGTATYQK